jgi:diphthine-ammonia ligase
MQKRGSVGVLYSGGKDSTFACSCLIEEGYNISCLITVRSQNQDSYMLHTSNIDLAKLGAEALGYPIVFGETEGRKESELSDISEAIGRAKSEYDFDSIATGALASNYQKERVERIAKDLDLGSVSPLWHMDQVEYLRNVISKGYEFVLTSVSCEGLDETFLGKTISPNLVETIIERSRKFKFNPAFEGGEAETLVLDCPLFQSEKIKIQESKINWNGYSGQLIIERAALVAK